MDLKKQMETIYRNTPPEKIPWNIEEAPDLLKKVVESNNIKPCKAIELGCGLGHYVMFLAQKGFEATGVDFSETAVNKAIKTASLKNIDCRFLASDVLGNMDAVQGKWDFLYDWELLHHIFPEDRPHYFRNVHRLLNVGKPYMSVSFSEDSPQFGGRGKYRETPLGTRLYFSSENEIRLLAEPLFDIVELETVDIEGKFAPHRAIYGLFAKK